MMLLRYNDQVFYRSIRRKPAVSIRPEFSMRVCYRATTRGRTCLLPICAILELNVRQVLKTQFSMWANDSFTKLLGVDGAHAQSTSWVGAVPACP